MAAPCYIIFDKNDTTIYRDTAPPFDLSTASGGAPERAMMRQRGDLLLIAEFDRCDAVGYISPTTGRTTATVDEIVMQLKPAVATSNPSGVRHLQPFRSFQWLLAVRAVPAVPRDPPRPAWEAACATTGPRSAHATVVHSNRVWESSSRSAPRLR